MFLYVLTVLHRHTHILLLGCLLRHTRCRLRDWSSPWFIRLPCHAPRGLSQLHSHSSTRSHSFDSVLRFAHRQSSLGCCWNEVVRSARQGLNNPCTVHPQTCSKHFCFRPMHPRLIFLLMSQTPTFLCKQLCCRQLVRLGHVSSYYGSFHCRPRHEVVFLFLKLQLHFATCRRKWLRQFISVFLSHEACHFGIILDSGRRLRKSGCLQESVHSSRLPQWRCHHQKSLFPCHVERMHLFCQPQTSFFQCSAIQLWPCSSSSQLAHFHPQGFDPNELPLRFLMWQRTF